MIDIGDRRVRQRTTQRKNMKSVSFNSSVGCLGSDAKITTTHQRQQDNDNHTTTYGGSYVAVGDESSEEKDPEE